ncbi:hypothetical protein [Arenibaculum sp.]|jgi:heme-degrading monooxygenase HmoA|uniref:hypothetical protein n=1 Tax=Arenibaculum sp. TaxID=2865862 RepID=UPI002E0FE2A0|nr:hypothetical protein [Arenibaculum sp.]
MIARIWRGWVADPEAADAYTEFVTGTFLPAACRIPGCRGAQVLRRIVGDEIEFMTILRFESIDAIKAFAGEDYEVANVAPRARELLSRFEPRCAHYHLAFEAG